MSFNWCYFPLESSGQAQGIQNPLPDFVTQHGNPWVNNNGWFNGDGASTALVTPWSANPAAFDGVALPGSGSYMMGFQVELGAIPASTNRTLFFCGHNQAGNTDGIRCLHTVNGDLLFVLKNRNDVPINKTAFDGVNGKISDDLINIFLHIDHRPAGTGLNLAFIHVYEDGSNVKTTTFNGADLSAIGDIYPQDITSSTALIIGADQINGNPMPGTYFTGKIRRLHLMRFGVLADDQPGNLAELMGELSKAHMVPTAYIQQIMGYSESATSRTFVRYT